MSVRHRPRPSQLVVQRRVLSQAVSYLSWLDSAHHEFEALVRKVLGAEAAESFDWRRPQMVCIAAGFSHHGRVAVQRLPERIDLVRYRVFDGGLLSLLLVDFSPGSPAPAASWAHRERPAVAVSALTVPVRPAPGNVSFVPACLRDLYSELDGALMAWGEVEVEVEVAALRHYIGLNNGYKMRDEKKMLVTYGPAWSRQRWTGSAATSSTAVTRPSPGPWLRDEKGPYESVALETSQSSAQPMMWAPTEAAAASTFSRCRSGEDVASFTRDSRRTPSRHLPHPS